MSTVSNFHYGAFTPIAAYLMACLGAALGLRCTTRSMGRGSGMRRTGWLTLGAVSIGCGIWSMHFIAMMGFTVDGSLMEYDPALTLLSLLVAIIVVAAGVFLVGIRGSGRATLGVAGIFTGLGVAAMHYLGMRSMNGHRGVQYDPVFVVLSILIAVAAATAALWAAVSVRKFWATLGASLVMGVAVTGMHYTGMGGITVDPEIVMNHAQSSASLFSFMLAMIAGPVSALVLASVIVMFDPDTILGDDRAARGGTATPLPATDPTPDYPQHAPAERGY
ncbi:MHYT domain-containing protein [Streptomyces sp. NPDC003832]